MTEVEASPFLVCEFLNGKVPPIKIFKGNKGENIGESILYVGYLLNEVRKDTESMIFDVNMCYKSNYYKCKRMLMNITEGQKEEITKENEDKYIDISFYTRDITEEDLNEKPKDGKSLSINKNIIDKAMHSRGRLDLYTRAYVIHCYLSQILNKNNDFLIALSKQLINLLSNDYCKEKFDEKTYLKYIDLFAKGDNEDECEKVLKATVPKLIEKYQKINDFESLHQIETLLIKLLGHNDVKIRNHATVLLNLIYDEDCLQLNSPFTVVINIIGDNFDVKIEVDKEMYQENKIFLYCITPNFDQEMNDTIFSFIKPSKVIEDNSKGKLKLHFEMGKFPKCGYYDWALIQIENDGKCTLMKYPNEKREIKGRYIIHNSSSKNLSIHEVYCDSLKSPEQQASSFNKSPQGNFDLLSLSLSKYKDRGINSIYIMGALERDNLITYDINTGDVIDIENSTSSPMAVVDRSQISSLLGGAVAFKSLLEKAKENNVKVFVDLLSRVSSSRYRRKYKDLVLHYIDEKGKKQIFYGCEGYSVNYDDTMILNYRDIKAWELLISDLLELRAKYGIDGVHIDNCQSWPLIMSVDEDEMTRVECDGSYRYINNEVLNGEVIIPNHECGYWNSEVSRTYPNPLLVKLTKKIWEQYPQFIFIGECANNNEKFSMRHLSLMKSGIIPRMYIMQKFLCSKNRYQDQKINDEFNYKDFIEWYKTNLSPHDIKKGIVINSSSGNFYPYPGLMYGKGNWPSVDALFTLDLLPMTFMDEIDGEIFRAKICNVYELEAIKPQEEKPAKTSVLSKKSKSVMKLKDPHSTSLTQTHRVSSFVKLSPVPICVSNEDINHHVQSTFGPEFDIKRISYHYDNRRKLRNDHSVLINGDLIFLPHKGSNKVLSFCRNDKDTQTTSIISINFSNKTESLDLDLKPLIERYDLSNCNAICYIEDWVTNQKGNFYFLLEILNNLHTIPLRPFSSVIFGIVVIPVNITNYSRVMTQSLSRMCKQIKSPSTSHLNVDSFHISQQLKIILEQHLPLCEFAKWMNTIQTTLEKYNIHYSEYFKRLNFINTFDYSTEYYKYANKMGKVDNDSFGKYKKLPLFIDLILKENKYGPICFVTPELGRWSTVGGLGVMVDELTTCLAKFGQEIIVISPYYHKNRKGEVGYLQKDPGGFIYMNNFTVNIDRQYTFEIYFGKINDVKLYFMHNEEIFPEPYHEGNIENKVRQIVLMGKASLELLCNIKVIPSIIVTNDWYTGLTVGYGKGGHFGSAFNQTTFFHICHNLETAYQGRIYTNLTYDYIHQLDNNWLIDPFWKEKVINPSRCAIMKSDQWGTVSKSYMNDLLSLSQLAPILRAHPRPFGFPNGIFKDKRLKLLNDNFHGDRPEAKKLIQTQYFKMKDLDDSIPVFSFVGRITPQKGVLLILECTEELIKKYNKKVQILVGGMANLQDPYCVQCVNLIKDLLSKFPGNFWAAPSEFFTDGTLINYGSDFGLMPSVFEPGGIVQHEFFIAGTPVLAFKTGGLKDSVFEYDYKEKKGNGVVFSTHQKRDFIEAFTRANDLFHSKNDFAQARKNAFDSAIDVMDVAKAWGREFYRLKGKTFFDNKSVMNELENFTKDEVKKFEKEISEYDESSYIFNSDNKEKDTTIEQDASKIPISFLFYTDGGKMNSEVNVCGSWDNWKSKRPLSFDPLNSRWNLVLMLNRGHYLYKYIVDGEWTVNQKEETKVQDNILNNYVDV